MKYLKFITIFMGILVFLGTAAIIYIVIHRLHSKQNFTFEKKFDLDHLQISKESKIVNANISGDKLVLIIKLDEKYQIIIYDLKNGKKLRIIETD